jgi:hypothetical protein
MHWLLAVAVLPWLQPGASFDVSEKRIHCTGGENSQNWLRSEAEYSDVSLRFEYRLAQWAEAIVVLRAHAYGRPSLTGIPIQLAHDFHNKSSAHTTGAVSGLHPPRQLLPPSFDQWHIAHIELRGDLVTVSVDGKLLQSTQVLGRHATGHVGFLDLGHAYAVRNLEITPLAPPRPYRPLFNGRNLDGWQLRDGGRWEVSQGAILAAGGHGIHYAPGEFSDFDLLAVIRTHNHVNSGIFLRGSPHKSANRGFEVQIYSPPDAVYPTGSIYGQTRALIHTDHDNQWTLLRIVVANDTVTTYLNGEKVAQGPVPSTVPAQGRIGLQIHLDNASIECKEIKILPLEPTP